MNTVLNQSRPATLAPLFARLAGTVAVLAACSLTLAHPLVKLSTDAADPSPELFAAVPAQPVPPQPAPAPVGPKAPAPAAQPPAPATATPPGEAPPPAAAQAVAPKPPTSFLLDSVKRPHVKISWPCRDKSITTLQADLEYQAPKQSVPIGKNLSAYAALGGTRGDLGLGAPGAVDVRVGFYKVDKTKPMFDDLADDAAITVEFTGIAFNQSARAKPFSALQHLKFEGNTTVLGCAGDPGVLATYNTLDPAQTIGNLITRKNGRPGALALITGGVQASVTFTPDRAGTVGGLGMKAIIPYAIFKHADDPWLRSNPGEFTEPVHFHLEFECEPLVKPTEEIRQTPKQAT